MATRRLKQVTITARIDDPNAGQEVRLIAFYSFNKFATPPKRVASPYGPQARRAQVVLSDLRQNTRYQVRLYTQDALGRLSKQYSAVTFWTNRPPAAVLVSPSENSEYNEDQSLLFDWKFVDPDEKDSQTAYQLRWSTDQKNWTYLTREGTPGKNTFITLPAPGRFRANTNYYWSVRVRDEAGIWSQWAINQSFFIRGLSSPPVLLDPIGGIGKAVIATRPYLFTWKFRDPYPANEQTQADIRWREVTSGDEGAPTDEGWFMRIGVGGTPGPAMQWEIPAGSFQAGFVYEWQVRTYDTLHGIPSGWSTSASFVATGEPGALTLVDPPDLEGAQPMGALGCGNHRVFVYDRGGKVMRGEIKPLARVQWSRLRDDISNALVLTNGFGADCCELLGGLRSWMHELVIFRDGIRVFEGPITRITYTATDVEIECKDVMAYLYRRIMRQGYNDAYRRIDLTPKTPPAPAPSTKGGPYTIIGLNTVVERALQITVNALAYQDPNVLPYVTAIQYDDDARQNRVVPDYSRTAWEEIDDLAATAGLDYTVVGRRIMYWDTHRSIGRLPEMRDGDFEDPVIVTEYGMQASNYFAVTNNAGIWGATYPLDKNAQDWHIPYGPVEMLSSAYGENEASATSTESMNQAAKSAIEATLRAQAQKGIGNRWPSPVVARVPDNSRLNPDVNLTIQQLVPGVWIPLRATKTCRNVSQWQKLDAVQVEQEAGIESIRVTMSPAPHGGNDDPDLAGQVETS